jgi:predicted nucleic-acid-binding protein
VIVVDTNVVVRLLARDDQVQYQASRALFETHEVFIPDTVVLELDCGTSMIFRQRRSARRSSACLA